MNDKHMNLRPALLCALLAAAFLAGCGKGQDTGADARPATDPNLVVVNAEMARNFKVAPLAMQMVSTERDLPGRIEANEQLVTRIGASVTGRVTEVFAEVGARVKAGQELARVSSPELTNAQLAWLRAHSATNQAQRAVERAQLLIQADVIGTAELQRREAELSIARAELRAATDQLMLLGVSGAYVDRLRDKGQLSPYAGINATRSGVVIERKVSQGQVAQPGDPLFTIADLSKVWVVGALPEQDAASVQMGQRVEIKVSALGQRQFRGRVVFVSDTISPDTRTLMVRTEVDNADRALKPQMLATLRIIGVARQQLAVPEAAVVRDNDRDHVYVQVAAGQYRLTPVELAPASNGLRPLLKGPAEGTALVVDGAFHLNNERKRAELE
ncbi:MAG: efflux RND transporter periplasmic adaptor subunit [Hylemonella sp.]|nr:efflux RND transporter periplasmic adaptor subunit [Hylemonella sp.]